MVKADVKRDYYADLELKSGADTEEIKKQFRKLGKRILDLRCCRRVLNMFCCSLEVSS